MDFNEFVNNFDITTALMIVAAIIVGILLIKILIKPIKFMLKFALHAAAGWVILFIANAFLTTPVNVDIFAILVSGILGIPGTILLIIFSQL